jgi:hypothetical protein
MDLEQELKKMLTPTEAARLKGMKLNKFKYHITKPHAPRPVFVGEHCHPFYYKAEIAKWEPIKRRGKPQNRKD